MAPMLLRPSLLMLASLAWVASADGDGDWGLSLRLTRGVLPALVICTLTLVSAVAVHAVVTRRRAPAKTVKASTKVVKKDCVLQRDDALEKAAAASKQRFPAGVRVQTKSRGEGVVRSYAADSDMYEIELVESGEGTAKLSSAEIIEPRVKDFYIYPIKSCAGIRLESAQIAETGLAHDREWMFADEKGKFITQRRYHRLALVHPKLVPTIENPTAIVLTAKGMPDLKVPIIREGSGRELDVNVWQSKMIAVDQGDAAAEWITTFMSKDLGERKIRLVHFKESFQRPTHERYAPGHHTGFADAFPILLTAAASLDELNKHLDEPVPMNRFRPNIVLEGCPAFSDDYWNCLTIGDLKFRNVRPCGRCNLPCVDQATGVTHPGREPSKTLVRVRNGAELGFTYASKADNYFGSNLVVEKTGRLSVGAPVKVLTRKDEIFA